MKSSQNRASSSLENPFFHRGPIRDPAYFYNRKIEVERILQMLGRGQSVSLIGPRKIGKTSLLFYVTRPEVLQQYGLNPARNLVVYFNCEGLGNLKSEEFYSLILEEVVDRASQHGHHLTIPLERPISYFEFERALRTAFDQQLSIALLLDEFEFLSTNRDLSQQLMPGLRALAQQYNVAYLAVSQRGLIEYTQDYSPFFNIFLPLQMGLFNQSDSRELIEKSMIETKAMFLPESINCILELAGGNPFFLQVVSYWALEVQTTKGAPLDSSDFHILSHTVRSQVESHFEYYWKHLTPQERYVLAALPFSQGEETYREQLETLAYLCLIVKEDGKYKYFSSLFRDFVRRQAVENLLQAGPLVLVLPHQHALLREEPLPLSTGQFALLSYLVEHQGQVVSNEELDRKVLTPPEERQEYQYLGNDRLESAIRGLRKSLGDDADCIVNKRGVGYLLRVRPEE